MEILDPIYYANGIAFYHGNKFYKMNCDICMFVCECQMLVPSTMQIMTDIKWERENSNHCLKAYNLYLRVGYNNRFVLGEPAMLYSNYRHKWQDVKEPYEWKRNEEFAKLSKLFDYEPPINSTNKKFIEDMLGIQL